MRTTWRVTCLGLMVLGPLLTACGGDDDNATDEASATSTSAAAPSTGAYGEPTDPDAGEPTQVATDTPAARRARRPRPRPRPRRPHAWRPG